MTSSEIRQKFLAFFKERNHTVVPSSSLIPDDPSVLLTTAGMQQFKKYFTGELDPVKDFGALRVASIQKCFRTSDVDEVGDETHLTFFEMLGHFSFGDYFKKETIEWTYELLTKAFNVPKERISATVFEGDAAVPFDEESFLNWSKLLPQERVRKGPRKDNFWGPAGAEGPCGACNEVYVDDTEVATLVFMEYYCHSDKTLEPLAKKGVDVGWGFERLVRVVQNVPTIFETDLFVPLMDVLRLEYKYNDVRARRILADHIRAVTYLIADGVEPDKKGRGYILRHLLRKIATNVGKEASIPLNQREQPIKSWNERTYEIIKFVGDKLIASNGELQNKEKIFDSIIRKETDEFINLLKSGKELEEVINKYRNSEDMKIPAKEVFRLYSSLGVPIDYIKSEIEKHHLSFNEKEVAEEKIKHQEISRAGAEKKFGGHGLVLNTGELKAGNEEELKKVTRLHTATHLLQRALREVLGKEVEQRGSDITPERTRFDFSFSRKMTPEEIKKVENLVNEKIKEDLPVNFIELPKAEAEKTGALHFFSAKGARLLASPEQKRGGPDGQGSPPEADGPQAHASGGKTKYPEKVKVYFVGPSLEKAWSKEFCGGPHVERTGEIGKFKIIKEEAVSSGVRRIRGVVE